jgi:hypothetical protein
MPNRLSPGADAAYAVTDVAADIAAEIERKLQQVAADEARLAGLHADLDRLRADGAGPGTIAQAEDELDRVIVGLAARQNEVMGLQSQQAAIAPLVNVVLAEVDTDL